VIAVSRAALMRLFVLLALLASVLPMADVIDPK
jgi:hypothetical protein